MHRPHHPHRTGLARCVRAALLAAGLLSTVWSGAQTISDVPMAVKNNVAPNFMFMIDNSGSMSNIVPTSPYNAATDYTPAGCTGANVLGTGTSIDLRIATGAPRIRVSGTDFRHWTLAASGTDRRCFNRTAQYSARLLADNAGSPSGYLDAEYLGNYLNWYFGTSDGPVTAWVTRKLLTTGTVQTRMEIARSSAVSVVAGLPVSATQAKVRAGLSAYNGADGGRLHVAVGDLNAALVSTLTTSINALTPTGSTPLAETLADIGRYMATGYSGNIAAGTVNGVTINNFLRQDGRESCLAGTSCATTTTDAVPAQPWLGTTGRPIQYWCQRSYAFLMTDGRPQSDQAFQNNSYLRDYDGDCSGVNAVNCAGGFDRKIARNYESAGSDYLDDVAKALFDVDLRPNLPPPTGRTKRNNLRTYTIGFADLQVQNDPLLINTAAQGGGQFLSAQDGPSLTTAFASVITDAFARDAAAAAVAVANAQITLNNTGYASSYNSGSWYGDLVAYSLNTTTALQTGADIWSFRTNLNAQTPGSRKIVSFNGSTGLGFTAANFAGTPASLTAGVINYLRGDRTGEGSTYRARQHVLGDIINAEPVVVNYAGSVPIIYQGANDGMLHVVDGRTDGSSPTQGQELWAYVPRLVHANLADYSTPSYSHRYYMDGTPAAAEITGFSFSRLLVGALGKGGRGYYGLDITSYAAANEAAAASKVKWEFSHANMGYSFGTPLIVKTAAGWRVVVASGYDNGSASGGNGGGHVWVLNPQTGAVLATLSTGIGSAASPSGLTYLSKLANSAADALVRYVYGGDIQGNVWRIDLDSATITRIAQLSDPTGVAQPITAPPEVSMVAGSATKFIVQLGTGRYLADDDVPGTATPNLWATQRQSVYGVIDDTTQLTPTMPNIRGSNGGTCPAGGGSTDYVCQTLSFNSGTNSYQSTTHALNPATKRGWYSDLPADSNLTNGRVISKPALTTTGTLTLTANVPTSLRCDPGGSSWFFAFNSANGGAVPRNVGGNTYFDAGQFLAYALASRPVIVQTSDGARALIRLSDKTVQAPRIPEAASNAAQWRRIYWRSID